MRQSIELNPTADDAHVVLAAVLIDSGRVQEAAAEFDQDLDTGEKEIMRPLMLEALGQHAEAERQMALVQKKYGSSAAHEIAIFYAYRREPDAAFAWLDRAYQNHEKMMLYVKTDPYLRNLHSDPRFSALVQRMKIPD
ncbi:MAG: TPR end-of-group domain-containing protein [Steroidobacterales bacterium]